MKNQSLPIILDKQHPEKTLHWKI